jgi:antitoxin VapB
MSLNIKDPEAAALAAEVAGLTGESKTRAVKVALYERRERLMLTHPHDQAALRLRRFLEHEAWPQIPADNLGRPLSRAEREAILGYGSDGF